MEVHRFQWRLSGELMISHSRWAGLMGVRMLPVLVRAVSAGGPHPLENAAVQGACLGAHSLALLPQLGHLHPAHVDAHVLQPGKWHSKHHASTQLILC
jgi:hypothetical protein